MWEEVLALQEKGEHSLVERGLGNCGKSEWSIVQIPDCRGCRDSEPVQIISRTVRRQWASQDSHHDYRWWRCWGQGRAELEEAGLGAGQRGARRQGQSLYQLRSFPSGELKGEPETGREACQADRKSSKELMMALALALCTLRELPSLMGFPETGLCVGSGSIANPDGHVSQACFLYPEDRSLLLAAGRCPTPGLSESAKDWIPVHMRQDTGATPKPDEDGCSHSEPEICIVNLLTPSGVD